MPTIPVYLKLWGWLFIGLQHYVVTSRIHAGYMNLSPSLSFSLRCPKRYSLEYKQRQKTLAPFASSIIGKLVHKRIAQSLRTNQAASTKTLELPRRLLLQEHEDLYSLCKRAEDALRYFNESCLRYLKQHSVTHIEHRITTTYSLEGQRLSLTGVIDCIIKTPEKEHIIDWKTSSVSYSQEQLKFYLCLRELETQKAPKSAEAISLSQRNSHCESYSTGLENWLTNYLKDMLNHLEKSQSQEAISGRHCTYCPYAPSCKASEAPERYVLDTWTGEVSYLG